MLESGYIKLYRSLLNWEWYDDINTKTVFLHLLLTVSIAESQWHGITVPRGSRVSSYAVLASETKLSVDKVRTAIKHLETTGEITRCKYPKCTVFTVNNYDKFQNVPSISPGDYQDNPEVVPKSSQQNKKIEEDKEDIYLSIYLRWRIKRKSFNFSTISTTTNAIRGQTVCRAERHPYRCAKVLQLLQRTWMENQERSADYKLERHTGLLGQDRRNLSGQAKAGNLCFRECSSL